MEEERVSKGLQVGSSAFQIVAGILEVAATRKANTLARLGAGMNVTMGVLTAGFNVAVLVLNE